jgi:hypothetical protein
MRYYIVVEGAAGEKKLYPTWIRYVNSGLTQITDLRDAAKNAFYLVSGDGYPSYFKVIENAVLDVNETGTFDYLVVAVDSEEKTYAEKYLEIKNAIDGKLQRAQCIILIQHFCLETWALGNRLACRKNTSDATLLEYKNVHDVRTLDPENLPPYKDMNRSQFAFRYLKCMLRDFYPGAVYAKSRPNAIADENYFSQIKKRALDTQHIQSFKFFLDAWR